jgi:hypothetical protein
MSDFAKGFLIGAGVLVAALAISITARMIRL